MAQLTRLFTPGRIGGTEFKNRICMAPMGVSPGDEEGFITDRAIDYFAARASGGVGLIIVGAVNPSEEARAPRRAWVWHDKFIPRLQEFSGVIHREGGKIALQLMHHGMALSEPRNRLDPAIPRDLVVPSVRRFARTGDTPREATKADIKRLVEEFSEAVRRTRDAGFDAVEFHGAHGYLIHSFFSPLTNRRSDEYGGSVEKRARFACEIVAASRQKVGPDFPLIFRMSGHEFLDGGLVLEDVLRYAPLLVEAGADALHVSATAHESTPHQFPTYLFPEGNLVHLAGAVRKVVKVPVIGVAKLSDPFFAELVLKEGKADFISLGRGLLADPDWPVKAKEGRFDDIRHCIYCNNCLGRRIGGGVHGISCTVNPALMREKEFLLKPAASAKRVMVVGGGLAGMEVARVLAERGHQVTVYEGSGQLGGQWNIACQQEDKKKDFPKFCDYLKRGLDRAGVAVKLDTMVTPQLVRQENPDAVVVATGASPIHPDVFGAQGENVVQSIDVITGKAKVGQTVVVIGGRERGMELADDLSRKGKEVFLATRSRLGRDVERNIYLALRDRLLARGVVILEHASLLEIVPTGVYLSHNHEALFLKADTVVLAVGAKSDNRLFEELKGIVRELHAVGDCVEPRNALMAVREAAEIGRQI
ncbi:MAG: FAD-dependent oxidoreductase [Chloroflexota bacterium]